MNISGVTVPLARLMFASGVGMPVPDVAGIVFDRDDKVLSALAPDWLDLQIAVRLELLRQVLRAASSADLVALEWLFSGVTLDPDDVDFALAFWAETGVPVLSLIGLRRDLQAVETFGLSTIANKDLRIICAPGYAESAMIFAVQAAYRLLEEKPVSAGLHFVAQNLEGIVTASEPEMPVIEIRLLTGATSDRTGLAD